MFENHYSTSWKVEGDPAALQVVIERIQQSLPLQMRPVVAGQIIQEQLTLWLFEKVATVDVARILSRPGITVKEVQIQEAPEITDLIAGQAFQVLVSARCGRAVAA